MRDGARVNWYSSRQYSRYEWQQIKWHLPCHSAAVLGSDDMLSKLCFVRRCCCKTNGVNATTG
eukprot:2444-Heterococcus_DN1.PRE.1